MEKEPDARKDGRQKDKRVAEDEMVRLHHQKKTTKKKFLIRKKKKKITSPTQWIRI